MDDLIRRSEAIDELQKEIDKGIPPFDGVQGAIRCGVRLARNIIEDLPSAQPEVKEISYTDCANAMLMMWIDKVLTDGEYNRIMDKLNAHELKRRVKNG